MSAPAEERMAQDWFARLEREVIEPGLCTQCGSCAGVCPAGAVSFRDRKDETVPVRTGDCVECGGLCYAGCSGRHVDFPALNQVVFGAQPESRLLGVYRSLYVAHATDPGLRRAGASGGVLTAALELLFETGRIAGAYVLGMDEERPWLPKPYLARSFGEARLASQSKYVVRPYNVLLNEIEPEGPPLAYVGLPCHVHSLRKLQQAGHPAARRFRYVIGSYCGNILQPGSTEAFLRKHGVRDLSEVKDLAFRAGEWPGNMRVELHSGRVIEMPKFHANYLIPFYVMKRCLQCTDLTNEFADIAGGDAWAPEYEQRGQGFSLLLARTEVGQRLVDELIERGRIAVTPTTYEDCVSMHSHGLDLKKRGAFARIERQRRSGRTVPEYGYVASPEVLHSRRTMEWVMGWVFRLCSTSLARAAILWVPNRLIGAVFQRARTRWKGMTRTTKRSGLGESRFLVEPPGGKASADWQALGANPVAPLYEGPGIDRSRPAPAEARSTGR